MRYYVVLAMGRWPWWGINCKFFGTVRLTWLTCWSIVVLFRQLIWSYSSSRLSLLCERQAIYCWVLSGFILARPSTSSLTAMRRLLRLRWHSGLESWIFQMTTEKLLPAPSRCRKTLMISTPTLTTLRWSKSGLFVFQQILFTLLTNSLFSSSSCYVISIR